MTEPEFEEILGWLEVRWPHLRWTSVTVAALYSDLERFDPVDVWAAVHHLYQEGRDHPPAPSLIVARALEERRASAEQERLATPALPESTTGDLFWAEYARRTYGEYLTIGEAAERHHSGQAGCRSPLCDIHEEVAWV